MRLLIAVLILSGYPRRHPANFDLRALRIIIQIHTAQARHFSETGGYARSLQALAASGDFSHEDPDFRFTLSPTRAGYQILAVPTQCGRTASRSFYSDETLTIHQHPCPQPATHDDPEVK